MLDVDGKRVRVFDTWLHYLPDMRLVPIEKTEAEILAWDDAGTRDQEIKRILSVIQPMLAEADSIPVIMGGDFNDHSHLDMRFVGMQNRYYSFDKGDFHFIVLDPNNLFIDGNYIPYKNGNFYVDMSQREHLDPEQIEWLKKDLASTNKRCILFSHECFENTVQNRELVRGILETENEQCGFKKVVVAFSGHDHTDYTKEINGITYIQINSASNQWVGEEYACPERFSKEIDKEKPHLKYTVPYTDALYAIVTLDSNSLKMKGRQSTFIAPTPTDIGIPEDRYPFPLVPRISDFSLIF